MTSVSRNDIVVSYGKQEAQRRNFNWIFPLTKESIFVTASEAIKFIIEVPAHVTDKASYETNCRNFMSLANSAANFRGTRLVRGAITVKGFFRIWKTLTN